MLPLLQIGPLTLRTPGLALLAGLWIGLEVSARAGVRRGIPEDHIYNLGFYSLLAGVLGARLGYVLLHLDLYTGITPWWRTLLAVFALSSGTENPLIGLAALLALAAWLIRRWEVPLLPLLDALAPGAAVLAIGIGLANLLSGDWYGIETALPWGIPLWGALRHPTQIYFLIAAAGVLLVLLHLEGRAFPNRRPGKHPAGRRQHEQAVEAEAFTPGTMAQVALLLLSLAVLLIEPLRADSPVMAGGVRIPQVVALIGLLAALAGFAIRAPAARDGASDAA
ncbi:MAG: prolipoprotein diacylglyceryl transferase [Anaerolineae bacterium]